MSRSDLQRITDLLRKLKSDTEQDLMKWENIEALNAEDRLSGIYVTRENEEFKDSFIFSSVVDKKRLFSICPISNPVKSRFMKDDDITCVSGTSFVGKCSNGSFIYLIPMILRLPENNAYNISVGMNYILFFEMYLETKISDNDSSNDGHLGKKIFPIFSTYFQPGLFAITIDLYITINDHGNGFCLDNTVCSFIDECLKNSDD